MAVDVHDKQKLQSSLILCPEPGKWKETGGEVEAAFTSLKTGPELFPIRGTVSKLCKA